jgi:uncharacterized protein (TIGR03437 family)
MMKFTALFLLPALAGWAQEPLRLAALTPGASSEMNPVPGAMTGVYRDISRATPICAGEGVWRWDVVSPGANALRVKISHLPAESEVWIGSMGPYRADTHGDSFWTDLVYSERIRVEHRSQSPCGAAPPIQITELHHLFSPNTSAAAASKSTGPGRRNADGNPFLCIANAGVLPLVRHQDLAALTADIVLVCTGGLPLQSGDLAARVDIRVFYNTSVTSRLLQSGGWSEALLFINEPEPNGPFTICGPATDYTDPKATVGCNVFQGRLASENSVVFEGVPVLPSPSGSAYYRIANVRVNAVAREPGGPGLPGIVESMISITSNSIGSPGTPSDMPISNPQLMVGLVQPGLQFQVRDTTGAAEAAGGGAVIPRCGTLNTTPVGTLRFREAFPTAFRSRTAAVDATGNSVAEPVPQAITGYIYNSESGYYNPGLGAGFSAAGLADSGTRLRASFLGIPAGLKVWVSSVPVTFSNGVPQPAPASVAQARMIASAAGPFTPAPASVTIDGIPAVELPVHGGSAAAIWEVTKPNALLMENLDFHVWVSKTGSAAPATVTVAGGLVPSSSETVSSAGDASVPVPRFSEAIVAGSGNLLTTSDDHAAGSVTATGGTPQAAVVSTAFAMPLQATVKDGCGNPVAGAGVTFSAPASGASGTFSGQAAVTTNASGVATAPVFTANAATGTFAVQAIVPGLAPATFTLTNSAQPLTLTTAAPTLAANSTGGSIGITAPEDVNWTAASNASWLGIESGSAGRGIGSIAFSLQPNNSVSPRTATVTVTGQAAAAHGAKYARFAAAQTFSQTIEITQAGATGSLTLNPEAATASAAATAGQIGVTASAPNLEWTAVSSAQWLRVTAGTSGVGSGTVSYAADANTGDSRSATIAIGGRTFTLWQSAVRRTHLNVEPELLRFRYELGGAVPASQAVYVDSSENPAGFSVASSAHWLRVAPTGGSTPGQLRVWIEPAGLSLGNYRATLRLSGGAEVFVSLAVVPRPELRANGAALSFAYTPGGLELREQVVYFTGGDRPIAFIATPAGGSWLRVTVVNDSTLAPANLRVRADVRGLAPGVYTAMIVITAPEAANSPLRIPVTLTVNTPPPLFSAAALVNAATMQGGPLAPGEIVTLTGTNLACAGTLRVLVDGVSAHVLSANAGQIIWIVPEALAGKNEAAIVVACGALESPLVKAPVVGAAPGLFTWGGSGEGGASALNQDGSVNGARNGAKLDTIVALFGTGFGTIQARDVFARIGNSAGEIVWFGPAPNLPGVQQINVRIPRECPADAEVPIVVETPQFRTQAGVTLSIE